MTYGSGGYDGGLQGAAVARVVAVADVNGDGNPDLVVPNPCASSTECTNGTVSVLLGNGDGTFQAAVSYSSGGFYPLSVAATDVNGDGKPDLVVANECASSTDCTNGTVSVLLGNGDGTFQAAVSYGSGGYVAVSVEAADVNGDGKPDIVVSNYCASSSNCNNGMVGVLLGNGNGTFQPAVSYGSGGYITLSLAVADVNGDSKPDLIVISTCATNSDPCVTGSTVSVLLGNGNGTFQAAVAYGSGGYVALSVAVADVNGDNKPDLVVANDCASSTDCNNGTIGVLLGNGDGTFQTAVPFGSGGSYAVSVAVADVNADGKPDLVVANTCNIGIDCTNGVVGVLLGNGDGTFQAAVIYGSGGWEADSVAVANMNGDGTPNLVVANLCVSSTNCANGTVSMLINLLGPVASITGGYFNGVQIVGTTSYFPQDVVLTNIGETAMTVTSVTISGPPFAIIDNYCMKGVQPFTHCDIVVTFTPTAAGSASGSLVFKDNASNGTTQTVTLSGTGVAKPVATSTSVTGSLYPFSFYGQSVTLRAVIDPSAYGVVPTGTVTFVSGTTTLGTATVVPAAHGGACPIFCAVGSLNTTLLAPGLDVIAATYNGDATFSPSSGTTTQQVNLATTTLTSGLNPSYVFQSVTLTATVTGNYVVSPTGPVTFKQGATTLGTATLVNGQASISNTYTASGTFSTTAVYSGNADYATVDVACAEASRQQRAYDDRAHVITQSLDFRSVRNVHSYRYSPIWWDSNRKCHFQKQFH